MTVTCHVRFGNGRGRGDPPPDRNPMKAIKTKQVALYARVSTKDKGQDVEPALARMDELPPAHGYPTIFVI